MSVMAPMLVRVGRLMTEPNGVCILRTSSGHTALTPGQKEVAQELIAAGGWVDLEDVSQDLRFAAQQMVTEGSLLSIDNPSQPFPAGLILKPYQEAVSPTVLNDPETDEAGAVVLAAPYGESGELHIGSDGLMAWKQVDGTKSLEQVVQAAADQMLSDDEIREEIRTEGERQGLTIEEVPAALMSLLRLQIVASVQAGFFWLDRQTEHSQEAA